jgi:hypothetical protein
MYLSEQIDVAHDKREVDGARELEQQGLDRGRVHQTLEPFWLVMDDLSNCFISDQ